MIQIPIDPAATPQNDDAPDIAADDAGASALAEQAQKAVNDDETAEDGLQDGEDV